LHSPARHSLSRRSFLAASAAAASLALTDPLRLFAAAADGWPLPRILRKARLVGTLPFLDEGDTPFGKIVGEGLAARRAFDVSSLEADHLVTPNASFFLRTGLPDEMPDPAFWPLSARALRTGPEQIFPSDLHSMAGPMGVHLLSCVENGPRHRFGLIGAAEWTGIPMARLFERTRLPEDDCELLVEGYDRHYEAPPGPGPGASWIFRPGHLESSGAFLATGMNGETLPLEHGGPLRLVVPGWHGFTWIKWVHTLVFLPAGQTRPSPHMTEYAPALGYDGRPPRLARNFRPATLDRSALPVRIEHWRERRKSWVRIIGAVWGGASPAPELRIRLRPEDGFEKVDDYHPGDVPKTTWSLWSHTVRVKDPGRYRAELEVDSEEDPPRPRILADTARSFEITTG